VGQRLKWGRAFLEGQQVPGKKEVNTKIQVQLMEQRLCHQNASKRGGGRPKCRESQ